VYKQNYEQTQHYAIQTMVELKQTVSLTKRHCKALLAVDLTT